VVSSFCYSIEFRLWRFNHGCAWFIRNPDAHAFSIHNVYSIAHIRRHGFSGAKPDAYVSSLPG
jgi:hypothetical protein